MPASPTRREAPKKPTDIRVTNDQTIVVSDKFGDVFSYPIQVIHSSSETTVKQRELSSHENPAGGTLILGHTSLLTSLLLTSDEKYVITADRDEHIRVSWYPQGYNIEAYCLGHKK
jgi:tRNA (guanine-N(7)-)-methyltransferase subunit TRM82